MNKVLIAIVILVFFMAGCNDAEKKTGETKRSGQDLVGEWNNIYLKVNTNSKNNSDSNEVLEVDRPQWEEKLKIKPIRTFFREDSTWNSAHYTLKDSLFYDPSGKWWVDADKLTMVQLSPSPDTTIYTYHLNGDTISFESMQDWDMDGKRDDLYYGRQIRVKQ